MKIKKANLTPAELKAIETHQSNMSGDLDGAYVSLDDAIEDFVERWEEGWKKEKIRQDNLEQVEEIKKYKSSRTKEEGHEVDETQAALEWIGKYAHIWRKEKESLQKNGYIRTTAFVMLEKGLHLRPTGDLANIVGKYNCHVYVRKKKMDHYNFKLGNKRYLNVRSVLGLATLGAAKGDKLEFIANGSQAEEALQKVKEFVSKPHKEYS